MIARRRKTYRARLGAAMLAILAMLWMLLFSAAQVSLHEQGNLMFVGLSGIAFAVCAAGGLFWTAGALNSERREGTLGLLFLTDLKGYDVVIGKLLSSSLTAAFALMGAAPVLALGLLLGGVEALQMLLVFLVLANTLLFSLACGALASTVCESEGRALFWTGLMLGVANCAPPAIAFLLDPIAPNLELAVGSPVVAFLHSHEPARTFPAGSFWRSMAIIHLSSWLAFAIASLLIQSKAFEKPEGKHLARWREWWRLQARGNDSYRRRLLEKNPYSWLAGRDTLKPKYLWLLVVALGLIWVWVAFKARGVAFETGLSFLFVAQIAIKAWAAEEICPRFIDDRRSGALELILCTPMSIAEILKGQMAASRRNYLAPASLLICLCGAALWYGWRNPSFANERSPLLFVCLTGMIVFPLDLWAIQWLSMWSGLKAVDSNRAAIMVLLRIMLVPGIVFLALQSAETIFARFIPRQYTDVTRLAQISIWIITCMLVDFYYVSRARKALSADFRSSAIPQTVEHVVAEKVVRTVRNKSAFRWRIAPVLAMAVVLLAGGLWFWQYRHALKETAAAELEALRKDGYPTTVAEIRRAFPAIPGEENAAAYYREAIIQHVPISRTTAALPNLSRNRYPERGDPLTRDLRAELERHVYQNAKVLQIVKAAPVFEKSFYPVAWEEGFPGFWQRKDYRKIEDLARTIQADIALLSELDDPAAALQSLRAGMRMCDSLAFQPFNLSQRIRLGCLEMFITSLERILNLHVVSDKDLVELGVLFEKAESPGSLHMSFQGDLVVGIDTFKMSPLSQLRSLGPGTVANEATLYSLRQTMSQFLGHADKDYIYFLRRMRRALNLSKLPYPEAFEKVLIPQPDSYFSGPLLSSRVTPWYEGLQRQEAGTVLRLRAARTALAVERFRLANDNQLPEKLDELAPLYLPAVPLEPHNGKPLPYRKLSQGYGISDKTLPTGRITRRGPQPRGDQGFVVTR